MTETKKFVGFRLDPALNDGLAAYAKEQGVGKTAVVEELLYALLENRLRTIPREGPSAFPGEQHANAGDTSDFPVLVAPSTRDQVGAPEWADKNEIERMWEGGGDG